jgi:hypothetical protein
MHEPKLGVWLSGLFGAVGPLVSCDLVLDNALNNAFRHGCTGRPMAWCMHMDSLGAIQQVFLTGGLTEKGLECKNLSLT